MAELTADALSFYQNGNLVAKYTGSKVSFYAGGSEVMYIQSGKIYAGVDLELGSAKTVKIGDWRFDASGQTYLSSNTPLLQFGKWSQKKSDVKTGVFCENATKGGRIILYAKNGQNTDHSSAMIFDYDRNNVNNGYPALYPEKNVFQSGGTSIGTSDHMFAEGHMYIVNCELALVNDYVQAKTVWYNNLYQRSSTKDVKHDIQDMEDMGEILDRLRPVTFVYDDDPDENRRYGLIYEDTMPVLPDICTRDESHKTITYVELVPILLKEIQNLRQRVSELERR